jgi:hypothetical protein
MDIAKKGISSGASDKPGSITRMTVENGSQVRPGRKPGDLVRLDAKITADLDRALNELVLATGVAKASLVRAALAQYLAGHGALAPGHAELVTLAPTAGPGLASQRKDTT